jgi:hypothetical protein
MSGDQLARFETMIDAIDRAVADRPDVLASPVGFVVGALVGAGRSDPEDAWRQLAGFADVLAYVVMFVDGHPEASLDALVASLLPAA